MKEIGVSTRNTSIVLPRKVALFGFCAYNEVAFLCKGFLASRGRDSSKSYLALYTHQRKTSTPEAGIESCHP